MIPTTQEFLIDIIKGLSKNRKTLPCKYFYDERGSQLFEQICELDEYYITKTEIQLLESIKHEISDYIGPQANIIEPGSGAGEKVQILLSALQHVNRFMPLDISSEILFESAKVINERFPDIAVTPLVGDFTKFESLKLSTDFLNHNKNVIYFPGSTIGNFEPFEAKSLLESFVKKLKANGALLIGVDLVKELSILEPAYDDSQGITEQFNKNILHRINKEFDADFDVDAFEHKAYFDEDRSRIEMHLVSKQEQKVTIEDKEFLFMKDESIHTENSHKYSIPSFKLLAESAGWTSVKCWTDPQKLFSIHYFESKQ